MLPSTVSLFIVSFLFLGIIFFVPLDDKFKENLFIVVLEYGILKVWFLCLVNPFFIFAF